ncbi:MAG: hypothetical protein ACOY4W_16805 [Thermodesulfobacteriota bacterium]
MATQLNPAATTQKNDTIRITCDWYRDTADYIVFVNGHALNRGSCNQFIAHELAKAAGQKILKTRVFHDADRPVPYWLEEEVWR